MPCFVLSPLSLAAFAFAFLTINRAGIYLYRLVDISMTALNVLKL